MQRLPSNINEIVRDSAWLAHRYDPGHDAFHFRFTPRDVHRSVTFITDDCLPAADPVVLPRKDVMAVKGQQAPLHFIFHSAFCCSTLLARAFDIEGVAMGLKEPVVLNDISGFRRRGGDPRRTAAVLGDAIALLARPFSRGEAIIIKPSNVVNAYIPAMLTMRPQARALLLHAPLPVFLGSVARKGMWGRLWVRDLLLKLLADECIDLGFGERDYLGLTDLQAAAVGWIAQHALFEKVIDRFGSERIRTLDSETLLARPKDAIGALSQLYGLPLKHHAMSAIATGPAFTRHSKMDQAFDREVRDAERRELEAVHSDEIAKVSAWAEFVAANAGIARGLKAPLIS